MRRHAVPVALVASLVLTGCASAGTSADAVITSVGPDTAADIPVTDGATLHVDPGDFTGPGTVTIAPSTIDALEADWFIPAGEPIDITVSENPAAPLELTFTGAPPEPGAIPVVLRHDPELGWYPVASATTTDGPATAGRMLFSPHLFGWLRDLSETIAGGVRALLGDRSDPLDCNNPPEWAAYVPPAQDLVHTCATTGVDAATGKEVLEVQLRNNRGVYLEVTVPAGAAYAWVEDQPDIVRAAVRTLTGRDSILLAPGAVMSVGLARPERTVVTQVPVDISTLGVLTTLITEHVGADAAVVYAVLLAVRDCSGLGAITAATGGTDVLLAGARGLLGCAGSLLTGNGPSVIAAEYVAASNGLDPATVIADRTFAPAIDRLAGTLTFIGGALTVVSLGSVMIDVTADLYVAARVGDMNSMSPTLTLTGTQRPAASEPFGPDGFGPFTIGASTDQATAALPYADFAVAVDDGISQFCWTASSTATGVTAFADTWGSHVIFALGAWASPVRTPEGIGFGSTRADMQATYPSAQLVDETPYAALWGSGYGASMVVVNLDGPSAYQFNFDGQVDVAAPGDKITGMTLVADDWIGAPEWCD